MTNQEAIENLKILHGFRVSLSEKQRDQYTARKYREEAEALDMATAALEKQIPKKLTQVEPCNNGLRFGWCPSCPTSQVCETANYCKTCGQALDWED